MKRLQFGGGRSVATRLVWVCAVALVLMVAALLSGCSVAQKPTRERVVGTWRTDDGHIVHFAPDGTYSGDDGSSATYSLPDDEHITFSAQGGSKTWDVKFSGSGFQISEEDDNPRTQTFTPAENE